MAAATFQVIGNLTLNQTQYFAECQHSSEELYCGLFENRATKIFAMILSISLLMLDMVMVTGAIWYEHYGTDRRRTLMNKLFSSVCWVMIAQQCITMVEIIRYLVGPLSQGFCFILLLAKITGNSMILLFYDTMLLARYVLIFKLKNPGALNDEFWYRFLNIWVFTFSALYDSSRYFLPGKQTFSYYTCSGTSPASYQETSKRGGNVVEAFSLVMNIVISLRILIHKKSQNIVAPKASTTGVSRFRGYVLRDLDKTTIASTSSNFVIIFFLTVYYFLFTKLRTLSSQEYNVYPNYLYLYFHQLLWAPLAINIAFTLYYMRHAPLRNNVIRELKTHLGLESCTWISCK